MSITTVKMLLSLVMFINRTHLNSMLLEEAFTVRVLITCKKLWNIIGKTVIYHLRECVLSNVLMTSSKKIMQKNF